MRKAPKLPKNSPAMVRIAPAKVEGCLAHAAQLREEAACAIRGAEHYEGLARDWAKLIPKPDPFPKKRANA
jgi:hypothetical protein